MTFGEKLTRARKQKGLSQEALAGKLDITRQTISKWELDQSTPELSYLKRLCEILEVSADELLWERFPETAAPPAAELPPPSPAVLPSAAPAKNTRSSLLLVLGILLIALGALGCTLFLVIAALSPWSVSVNNWQAEGLFGALVGNRIFIPFLLCILMIVVGILLLIAYVIPSQRYMVRLIPGALCIYVGGCCLLFSVPIAWLVGLPANTPLLIGGVLMAVGIGLCVSIVFPKSKVT